MKHSLQKRLAAAVAKAGLHRVKIRGEATEIKEAITKADVRKLIDADKIVILPEKSPSRVRARKRHLQQKKGRQRGHGHRKGKQGARVGDTWINKIRVQRKTLHSLKQTDKLEPKIARTLYRKAKGGFFRSRKHLLTYIDQNKLRKTEEKVSKK